MAVATTAAGEWTRLDGLRSAFITRCEKYAGFTLPRLCTPSGRNQNSDELSHDWQSVGAQATNHVVNKLMLALFAPSRPFFRLEADAAWKQSAMAQGIPETAIDESLAQGELLATKELDRRGTTRPKLYQIKANLVVLGNALVYLPRDKGEDMRVFGIKSYVVRRTGTGKVKTIIVKEDLMFDELEQGVQDYCKTITKGGTAWAAESSVSLYRWIELQRNGKYLLKQSVNNVQLPAEYDGSWPEAECPWRVLTWQLADKDDYGTGLVEDFSGDFAALSALSEAQVKGAILASEFRWLVNPGGMTKPEDFETSENGSAIPGLKDDITLVANSKPGDLQVVQAIGADYIRRIGQGFLLNSAVTRDAERVTAEEIRQQAQELETSFGGTYSRIAVDLQGPVADWLLSSVNIDIKGAKIKRVIVTGLDALSRSGDLDNLRAALADLAGIGQLPDWLVATLKLDAIAAAIFQGHGLPVNKYTKDAATIQQEQQAAQEQQKQMMAAEQGAKASSQQLVQEQTAQ